MGGQPSRHSEDLKPLFVLQNEQGLDFYQRQKLKNPSATFKRIRIEVRVGG
jgi:hypothetical protein